MWIKVFFTLMLLFTAGGGLQSIAAEVSHQYSAKEIYVCPMHPKYTSDKKGICPICGMDLVKKEIEPEVTSSPVVENKERKILFYRNPMDPSITSSTATKDQMGMDYVPVYEEEKGALPGVPINIEKQQLIGVKKEAVILRPLTVEIATVGKVAYDPDLYVAQEEYIQALKVSASMSTSALVSIREQSDGLVASAERKLLLLGMSKDEVAALKNKGVVEDNLYFPTRSGKAWVYITIYEYELGSVKEGQAVMVDALPFPGEVFTGKITALTPIVNAESRSIRARAEVEDKDGKLKPEMFVNAKIFVDLGEKLAIPEEAVMDTGTRKIVYVVKDDRFEARDVILGPKAGAFYQVLSGLEVGDEVVKSGNFLVDAESKLKTSF